jgi:hypothetical protein
MWLFVCLKWVLELFRVSTRRGILSAETRELIRNAERVEVFSLAGVGAGSGPFHNAPILGSVVVECPRERRRLLRRILLANRFNLGGFLCLGAEYGIRLTYRDTTRELTLCFDCSNVWVTGPNGHYESGNVMPYPVPLLETILRRAQIPLPPRKHEHHPPASD